MIEAGAYPSPLNYYNFPKSVCTSVNEVGGCRGVAQGPVPLRGTGPLMMCSTAPVLDREVHAAVCINETSRNPHISRLPRTPCAVLCCGVLTTTGRSSATASLTSVSCRGVTLSTWT